MPLQQPPSWPPSDTCYHPKSHSSGLLSSRQHLMNPSRKFSDSVRKVSGALTLLSPQPFALTGPNWVSATGSPRNTAPAQVQLSLAAVNQAGKLSTLGQDFAHLLSPVTTLSREKLWPLWSGLTSASFSFWVFPTSHSVLIINPFLLYLVTDKNWRSFPTQDS